MPVIGHSGLTFLPNPSPPTRPSTCWAGGYCGVERTRTSHASRSCPCSSTWCPRDGVTWLQTLDSGQSRGWEGRGIQRLLETRGARHQAQRVPVAVPVWPCPGRRGSAGSGPEERTYHLIVDRGGWWVVVGEQSCRDWPPVSQVIILEEKGNWRGEGVWLGHRLPQQLKFKIRDVCILSQNRCQIKMDSSYPLQHLCVDLSGPQDLQRQNPVCPGSGFRE